MTAFSTQACVACACFSLSLLAVGDSVVRASGETLALVEQTGPGPAVLAAADFDEDGVPDLASAVPASEGGVVTLHRADAHRYRAFEIKMAQVQASGATRLATSCSNCRLTFDDGRAHYGWDRKMESLLEIVAEQLDDAR